MQGKDFQDTSYQHLSKLTLEFRFHFIDFSVYNGFTIEISDAVVLCVCLLLKQGEVGLIFVFAFHFSFVFFFAFRLCFSFFAFRFSIFELSRKILFSHSKSYFDIRTGKSYFDIQNPILIFLTRFEMLSNGRNTLYSD